jgi:RAQPRD family integrative conjugative element protein
MFPSRNFVLRVGVRLCLPLLAVAGGPPALADEAPERERLAALVRQIELIDRLAEGAAQAAPQGQTRYRFDYLRLREDLARVRAGVQDYLIPLRAQPRDPAPLVAHYKTSQARPPQSPHSEEAP